MPTYEYECLDCGKAFEIFQNMTAKPLKKCPKCKGKVKRLIGRGSGIIFKGSGFYATDYKKGKKNSVPSCPQNGSGEGCKGCQKGKA
ncbi:MAG: FmdB family zinc ribbon protein [Candidatus Omnitrophota bacterium]